MTIRVGKPNLVHNVEGKEPVKDLSPVRNKGSHHVRKIKISKRNCDVKNTKKSLKKSKKSIKISSSSSDS